MVLTCLSVVLQPRHVSGIRLLIGQPVFGRVAFERCEDDTIFVEVQRSGDVSMKGHPILSQRSAALLISDIMATRNMRTLYVRSESGTTMQQFSSFLDLVSAHTENLNLVWVTEQMNLENSCIAVNWEKIRH
jgi:hypothetical protein